jgi:acyl-CoA reductase-like NAD-dependent aldehyde dehydrogenase
MNERIKKLAEQASQQSPDGYPVTFEYTDQYVKKFAELLIKKFDDILLLEYIDCVGNKDKKAADRIARLRGKVETYFGVGECD